MVEILYKGQDEKGNWHYSMSLAPLTSILSCVNFVELALYLGGKDFGYGLDISNLVIYDKPSELSEFCITDNEAVKSCEHREQSYHQFTDTGYIKNGFLCTDKFDWCTKCKTKLITKPPQSWCYVEELTI